MHPILRRLFPLSILLLSGCENPIVTPGGEEVTEVRISPVSPVTTLDAAIHLTAVASNSVGHQLFREARWESLTPEILTIDSTGMVRALAEGQGTVRLTVEGISTTTSVRVTPVVLAPWSEHICALAESGSIWCWGRGTGGELGSGRIAAAPLPLEVPGGGTFIDVAVGAGHTCALRATGAAACWGRGVEGQLGNAAVLNFETPVSVGGGVTFRQIAAGERHSCGISSGSEVYCWGWNTYGQLGNGTTFDLILPVRVALAGSFVDISLGAHHSCALRNEGSVWCWGLNDYGQLGTGTAGAFSRSPVRVASAVPMSEIDAGAQHTCALAMNGGAYCWGRGDRSQLGDGQFENRALAAPVALDLRYSSLSAGLAHTCAVALDGGAYCWGDGRSGQIGDGRTQLVGIPTRVEGGSWISISAGTAFSCGIAEDRRGYCWGFGGSGQLGSGGFESSNAPTPVSADFDLMRLAR